MLRVTDAPGVYAAFPWGGYAREKGATVTRSNAIGARALYSPLSPPASSYTWPFIRARCDIDRAVHRGPPPGAFRRGGQFSTRAYLGHASNTKGPLRRKTCTKDDHDSRGRNYKAETQLPTFAWASLPI